MNKTTIIIILVLLSIVYIAFDRFISNGNDVNTQQVTSLDSGFSAIKPPTITDVSNDTSGSDGLYTEQMAGNDQSQSKDLELSERQTIREELVAMQRNRKITYTTLSDMIDKINANKSTPTDVKYNVARIKHNLVIAKKMAELTKRLHVDVDGEKELDKKVFEELLVVQKQLLIPSTAIDFSSENENGQ